MADIAAGDVTYTVTKQRKEESGNKINSVTIAFGNSTLTYPSGGVPLTKASMGCPNAITSAVLEAANSGDGLVYKYDKTNNKIRIYRAPAQTHSHDLKITKGAITASTEIGLSADAASATLNNNTIAATLTLAKATNGIQSETLAAANLVELTAATTAVVAATLYMEVIGW